MFCQFWGWDSYKSNSTITVFGTAPATVCSTAKLQANMLKNSRFRFFILPFEQNFVLCTKVMKQLFWHCLQTHRPSSYAIWPWWTSSTGKEADLESTPGIGWPPLPGGVRTRPCALLVQPGQTFMGSPRRCLFLPGPLAILYPTSNSPAAIRVGRKGFNPAKSKNKIKKIIQKGAYSPYNGNSWGSFKIL